MCLDRCRDGVAVFGNCTYDSVGQSESGKGHGNFIVRSACRHTRRQSQAIRLEVERQRQGDWT
ncbi:hypothetical protein GJA_3688 [Janthinobacterium agaricidamnosum NBRC 102515 = DSM 9628]|uniref:Uncharacterized protein n=1 Tax=Janthinobacterium agaricidamnosum NBRC 102515 = DSM 9628 TaxID=1349767 RepID=W0VAB8_9BURK|nr:hypothetical protein GJA_3688 [Janthinobacterium agaricidamnosum NBRC 102515 = DSM 9628]